MQIHCESPPIERLGEAKILSPLPFRWFIEEGRQVLVQVPEEMLEDETEDNCHYLLEEAGPKEQLYFDPSKTKCAIVTCGGLCPGVNDVIRAIVMEAHHNYGIPTTLGIRYGLEGFIPSYGHEILELTPEKVSSIHEFGGTILASSRGPQPPEDIVDALERMNINILFLIGGDGTMKAASSIASEVSKRGLKISIIGIPKTIDNDIHFVSRSFGFDSAVEKATESIRSAHTESLGAYNGIGLVKLMGREAGFIAAEATLALKDVNFVLVPEDSFDLYGENGFLAALKRRIKHREHAVIVVAEGAGQNLCYRQEGQTDASGNPVLCDICSLLKEEIKNYFQERNIPYTLKFIDPSYIIRSIAANAKDAVYCGFLGQNALHAAMSGKTNMVASSIAERFVYLPLEMVTRKRRKMKIKSNYWRAVLESTGQPQVLRNKQDKAK